MIALFKQYIVRYTVIAGFLGLVLLGLYLYLRVHSAYSVRGGSASAIQDGPVALPKDDTQQIIVDPRNHTLIITKPGSRTVTHLPDVPTVIDVKKDGTTVVTAPQWGLEVRPFIGFGFSDDARLALGIDWLYWKRLDLGAGIQTTFKATEPRAFVSLSYNVKDNLRVTATYDHTRKAGAFLSLRF